MIRPATEADADFILRHQRALDYGEDEHVRVLLEEAEGPEPLHVMVVDREADAYCRLYLSRRAKEVVVTELLPRAAWDVGHINVLIPVLVAALRHLIAVAPYTLAENWTLWGEFRDGRNRRGQRDGGKQLCEAWRKALFPDATVARRGPTSQYKDRIRYRISYPMRDAMKAIGQL